MDIESTYHLNTNDHLLPAQLKLGQVETRGMTVVLAMTATGVKKENLLRASISEASEICPK